MTLQPLLDLLFPPRCVVCRSVGAVLCAGCLSAIKLPRHPLCPRCGRTLPAGTMPSDACVFCTQGHAPIALASVRAAAAYEGNVRLAILALKFRGQRRIAEPLGDLLADVARRQLPAVQLAIPVPLHEARRRQRGYNQAELLASRCAARLGVPCDTGILHRRRSTLPQVGLPALQRRANVAGAFEIVSTARASSVAGKRVLLVDDVATTGSTLDAAATALLRAGPAAIYGLAVARPDLADEARDVVTSALPEQKRSGRV